MVQFGIPGVTVHAFGWWHDGDDDDDGGGGEFWIFFFWDVELLSSLGIS